MEITIDHSKSTKLLSNHSTRARDVRATHGAGRLYSIVPMQLSAIHYNSREQGVSWTLKNILLSEGGFRICCTSTVSCSTQSPCCFGLPVSGSCISIWNMLLSYWSPGLVHRWASHWVSSAVIAPAFKDICHGKCLSDRHSVSIGLGCVLRLQFYTRFPTSGSH